MNTFAAFLVTMRLLESGGDYQAVNTLNFLGAYQFGEAALIDLGLVRRDRDPYDNDFGGGWTGKYGIRSADDFLANQEVQDRLMQDWLRVMWSYIEMHAIDGYAGKTVGQVKLTASGMLAASHLLGAGALKDFIASGGQTDLRDPYGTSIVTYIQKANDYEIPFL